MRNYTLGASSTFELVCGEISHYLSVRLVVMIFQWFVLLYVASLSSCQQQDFTCYSSRSCRGDIIVNGTSNSMNDKSRCCVAGGGLSFNTITCQECYGEGSFDVEGDKFLFGLIGNFEPVIYFRINRFRLYVNPVVPNIQSTFTVNVAGTPTTYSAPTEVSLEADQVSIQSDDVRDRAIVVQSLNGDQLSVVGYAEEFTSSDTFKVLPCVYLPVENYEYYAISVPVAQIPREDEGDYEYDDEFVPTLGNSAMVIVTTEEDTELTISLTQSVDITAQDLLDQVPQGKFDVGVPVKIQLTSAAQTVYIASEEDLTGSRITSNKPIAFISGHECGTIPNKQEYCDQLLEQVPPTATWGRSFITCPIAGREAHDVFKVIASQNDSVVNVSCTGDQPLQTFNLQSGEFTSFEVLSTIHCYVSSNRPILLVQYSIVSSVDGVFRGDPFMVIVPPVEQYRSSYDISVLSATNFAPETYYINVLLPEGASSSGLRINGLRTSSNPLDDVSFTSVPCSSRVGSCGSSAQVEIENDQYTLTHENSSVVFNAIVYWVSYRAGTGYFAGMTQRPIALPRISFSVDVFEMFENQTSANILLTRSGDLNDAGSFRIKTVELSSANAAIPLEDFEVVDVLVEFSANQVDVVVSVPLVDDVFPEGLEEFEVILLASPGVFIDSPASAIVRILNDDPDLPVMNVTFADVSVEVVEGVGVVSFVLMKTPGAVGPVSVQIATEDGTAEDFIDYISINQTVIFEVIDMEATVETLIIDNSAVEGVEQFSVMITAVPGLFPVAVQNSTAVVSISDNDVVVIGFNQTGYSVQEGMDFTVAIEILYGTLDDSVVVNVISLDETAVGELDYIRVQEVLTFDNLFTNSVISVSSNQDNLVETDESFLLEVQLVNNDVNVRALQNQAIVTIVDRDDAVIGLQEVRSVVREGEGAARLNVGVLLGSRLSEPVIIRLVTANIDAIAGSDFTAINTTIQITNSSVVEVLIEITDDLVYEGTSNEQFKVIASLEGGTFDGRVRLDPSFIEISIEDNDPSPRPTIGFRDSAYSVCESDGVVNLLVESDGTNPEDVVVDYFIVFSNATQDISADGGTLTFTPRLALMVIPLTITDDAIVETSENFEFGLQSVDGNSQISVGTTEVTITDDDVVAVEFEQNVYSIGEGGEVDALIRKIGETSEIICVSVNTESRTASDTLDFEPISEQLCFTPGMDRLVVTVSIKADNLSEGNSGEVFLLRLSPVANTVDVDITEPVASILILESQLELPSLPEEFQCSATSNSISCFWEQSTSDTVTNYLLSLRYIEPCDTNTQSFILDRSTRNYMLNGLEEGGLYNIMLNAVNAIGSGLTATIQVATENAAPTGAPQSVRTTALSTSSARVQWNPVTCLDLNGPVVQYILIVSEVLRDSEVRLTTTDTVATITDLVADQQYSIQVAAENSVGIGPFSEPVTLVLVGDPCSSEDTNNCDANSMCIDTPGSFMCLCNQGYSGDGVTCDDIDECDNGFNNCDCDADCNNNNGSFTCSCKDGFIGDGFTCSSQVIQFEFGAYTFMEGDEPAISVVLSSPADSEITVLITSLDGTANADGDYALLTESITFIVGDSSVSVPLQITDDRISELAETFTLSLADQESNIMLGDQTMASIEIVDNDELTVQLNSSMFTVTEGDDVEVFSVLSFPADRDVLVDVLISATDDLSLRTTSFTFMSGATLSIITVSTLDDRLVENTERFEISLTGPTNGLALGDVDNADIVILDNDELNVQLNSSSRTVVEGGQVDIVIFLNLLADYDTTVQISTRESSASAPGDFTAISRGLTFIAGQRALSITLGTIDDTVFEVNEETVEVRLTDPSNGLNLGEVNSTSIIIFDDDSVAVGFDQSEYLVQENAGTVELRVNLNGLVSPEIEITLSLNFISGSATDNLDYTSTEQELTLSRNRTTVTVSVPIIDDNLFEDPETLFGNLTIPSGSSSRIILAIRTAQITISNDDSITFGFIPIEDLTEGTDVEASLMFGVIDGQLGVYVEFNIYTADASAIATRDYIPVSNTVNMTENTLILINVNIVNDEIIEGQEFFSVIAEPLFNLTSEGGIQTNIVLNDDDSLAASIGFTTSSIMQTETNRQTTVELSVLFSGQTDINITVMFSTQDITAVSVGSDADYVSVSRLLTFSPAADGVSMQSITVPVTINGDSDFEEDEMFTCHLSSPQPNVTLSPAVASVTINNDDAVPLTIGFEESTYTVSETDGTVTLRIVPSGMLTTPLSLAIGTVDGTADSTDYTPPPPFLLLFPQQASLDIIISITSDDLDEVDETFSVVILSIQPPNADPSPARTTVTIIDACTNGELRLQDGQNSLTGRVEICMDKVWGSICDTLWDAFDAAVVCRQLGFSDQGAIAQTGFDAPPGPEDSPIYLDEVECRGDELRLEDCVSDTNTEDCFHDFQDSGVICEPLS